MDTEKLKGILGYSGKKQVITGFADARVLYRLSFSDVLDEESGKGYQRRFNVKHSLDFRKYIQQDSSTTIPLTFNLRNSNDNTWSIKSLKNDWATITIRNTQKKYLSQVDCQHRLGYLSDVKIQLPFMIYIGLTITEEMSVFNIINSKSKGLNSSLLDYHDSQLANDLADDRPELYIALQLNQVVDSPWYKQLDLGGNVTSGMHRRASFRTMQKSVKRFLAITSFLQTDVENYFQYILDFWKSIHYLLNKEWNEPRNHIINKGIGVYALMELASIIYQDASKNYIHPDQSYITGNLSDFIHDIDWSNKGPFKGLGGHTGVTEAVSIILEVRVRNTRSAYQKRMKLENV